MLKGKPDLHYKAYSILIECICYSTTTSYEIKNLIPYTLYEFKVRSHNLDGSFGKFSQAVECRTVESGTVYHYVYKYFTIIFIGIGQHLLR